MTAYRPVLQQLCNSCASLAGLVLCFIACFILLVIAPLQARVHGVRQQGGRPSDAQYRTDVKRHPGKQVARRSQTHLRRCQVETRSARPYYETVLQLGWAGP